MLIRWGWQVFRSTQGNMAIYAAILFAIMALVGGGALDLSLAYGERGRMQQALDSGVLAAVRKTNDTDRRTVITQFISTNYASNDVQKVTFDFNSQLAMTVNADGSITAILHRPLKTIFLGLIGINTLDLSVKATAKAAAAADGPCLYVLGSSGQDVLINSGVSLKSTKCTAQVHSTANPAFIMNSGSTVALASFCVKGTNYIKNGGTLNNLSTGCAVAADPYAGTFAEPTVPATCTTSGYFNTTTVTMQPGLHCATGFNGSPTITFKPGLHIIKGTMIINSGATVIADGVTFYFPDTGSEIRANGGLKFTATAPTSGTYKGVLMFEKTSNAANNATKTQYIFNGSLGETLEGIIYLPNRNVTYNSTTNVTAKISMVVNQVIMNSSNWLIEPYTGGATSGGNTRLTE